jgi:hypothetical protein
MLLGEVVDQLGTTNDFIGHAGGDSFVLITTEQAAPSIKKLIKERFDEEVLSHYNFLDREQGYIMATGSSGQQEKVSLMSLAIGEVSPSRFEFADIREITETAAEVRRQSG